MPRCARTVSKTGIYHIMLRGINRQTIFEDNKDYHRFLKIIQRTKGKSEFELYGYCLMGNHIHLLLKEGLETVSFSMQRICSSFVNWYNCKYDRLGHLFQERYKSEIVENETYLLTVLRYIHQNPVKAGISNAVKGYKWSSYHEYVGKQCIVNTEFILALFASDKSMAMKKFIEFNNELNEDLCLDYEDKHRMTDDEVIKLIEEKYGVNKGLFHTLERQQRDKIIRNLKSIDGVSIRQLVRVTGVSKFMVEKA